jgi:uncharacterized protein YeaO (DUF488 family)
MIKLKRVYEAAASSDGSRVLVERLWPRGVRKANLRIDAWLKEIGPSNDLRRWFAHDPKKWDVFRERYFAELDSKPKVWKGLVQAARRGAITLIYSSRDPEHNNAVALKDYLQTKMKRAKNPARRKLAA